MSLEAAPESTSPPTLVVAASRLGDLLGELGDEYLQSLLARFTCSLNRDVERFLHASACQFEKADKSRTYLAVAPPAQDNPDLQILGYFTLALKHLPLEPEVSNQQRKRLHGLFRPDDNVVVGFLVGQLARNDMFSVGIRSSQLLDLAIEHIRIAQREVGGRFVIIECAQEPKLLAFYQSYGFRLLQIDPEEGVAQLVYFL